jgi:hypothetical protein
LIQKIHKNLPTREREREKKKEKEKEKRKKVVTFV